MYHFFVDLFSVFSLCYGRIIYFLWKERRSVVGLAMQNQSSRHNLMKKTTSLMALVVTIYIITMIPTGIYLTTLSENVTKSQVQILDIFIFVYYCNSIVNPIICAFRITQFKKAYRRILDRICNRRNGVDVNKPSRNNMNGPHGSRRSNVPLEPRRFSFHLEPRDLDTLFRTSHK